MRFKQQKVTLPNNRPQARQRLKSLKKRLLSDDKYRQDYADFMGSIISKGYATKVSDKNATVNEGHVWYLPHHGVYHRQKTDSLRVVFDCLACYQGESLNDNLLQGLGLMSKLTGVLIRFREDRCDGQRGKDVLPSQSDRARSKLPSIPMVARLRLDKRTGGPPHDCTFVWWCIIARMF